MRIYLKCFLLFLNINVYSFNLIKKIKKKECKYLHTHRHLLVEKKKYEKITIKLLRY